MIFSRTVAILSLPFFVAAQYGPSPTTSSPSSTADPNAVVETDRITVGPGSLVFAPRNVKAKNGTTVTFVFTEKMHSVTQSSFAQPCTYLAQNGSAPAGFDSGITSGKEFQITITNDAKPIWFYCKVATHCSSGMVGAINAPATGNTYANYLGNAKKITNQASTPDKGPVLGGVNANATAAPAVATSTPTSTGTSSSTSSTAKTGAGTKFGASTSLSLLGTLLAFIIA